MADYIKTEIPDVILIKPQVFKDERGYFLESLNSHEFEQNIGPINFVQDNQSYSKHGVLRGLHYQLQPNAQSKLVYVTRGKVLDVAVDIRKNSPTYGQHVAVELSDENHYRLFVPRGFAHGFAVLSDEAIFCYKCDNFYNKESEGGVRFDDPDLNIDWGLPKDELVVAERDANFPVLKEAENNF